MQAFIDAALPQPIQEKYSPCAICDLSPRTILPHFHDAIEIIFTTAGSGTAICNGVSYQHAPGSVFFAASGEVHYFTDRSEDIAGLVIDIEPQLLTGAALQWKDAVPVSRIWEDPGMGSSLWTLVDFIVENQSSLNQDTLTSLVLAMLTLLLDSVELQKVKTPNATVNNILRYCQEHCTEEISLEILAKEFSLSLSHISRIFTQKLKISFSDYINGLRLNHAVKLMASTKLSITKIAIYAGFPTIRTFNRVFLAQHGMTPSQYRAMQK